MKLWMPVVLVSLLVAAFLAPAASAHDHAPPRLFLVTDRGEQRGSVYVTEWANGGDGFCTVGIGDGVRGFSDPVPFTPGQPMAIRFMKKQRPLKVIVTAWRLGIPVMNEPLGPNERVAVELRSTRHEGRLVWEAHFEAPLAADLYLDVVAKWKDEDGCGSERVFSTFHARVV